VDFNDDGTPELLLRNVPIETGQDPIIYTYDSGRAHNMQRVAENGFEQIYRSSFAYSPPPQKYYNKVTYKLEWFIILVGNVPFLPQSFDELVAAVTFDFKSHKQHVDYVLYYQPSSNWSDQSNEQKGRYRIKETWVSFEKFEKEFGEWFATHELVFQLDFRDGYTSIGALNKNELWESILRQGENFSGGLPLDTPMPGSEPEPDNRPVLKVVIPAAIVVVVAVAAAVAVKKRKKGKEP
jgi:hypothetical protein